MLDVDASAVAGRGGGGASAAAASAGEELRSAILRLLVASAHGSFFLVKRARLALKIECMLYNVKLRARSKTYVECNAKSIRVSLCVVGMEWMVYPFDMKFKVSLHCQSRREAMQKDALPPPLTKTTSPSNYELLQHEYSPFLLRQGNNKMLVMRQPIPQNNPAILI